MSTLSSASRTWVSSSSSAYTRNATPSFPRTPGTATTYRSVRPMAASTTSLPTSGWMATRLWHSGRLQASPHHPISCHFTSGLLPWLSYPWMATLGSSQASQVPAPQGLLGTPATLTHHFSHCCLSGSSPSCTLRNRNE